MFIISNVSIINYKRIVGETPELTSKTEDKVRQALDHET